jgi:hypothetical protein
MYRGFDMSASGNVITTPIGEYDYISHALKRVYKPLARFLPVIGGYKKGYIHADSLLSQ